jgi:hypothetical protein
MDHMMEQHEDPKFDAWLEQAAKSYNAPRPTPREEMWAKIEDARRHQHVIELRPWMRWAVAAAAVLVVGIGIGRWSMHQTSPSPISVATRPALAGTDSASAQPDVAYQVAATQYFSRTEEFLTSFRADLATNQLENRARFAVQARDLLSTTRLMLDSPVGNDQRLRSLLEDLELVLAQISQLDAAPNHNGHDADLITQGMNQSNVLPKLRSAIPAGPVPVRTEGAL